MVGIAGGAGCDGGGAGVIVTLPWPPSVNKYWRTPTSGRLAGRTMLSAQARAYRDECHRVLAGTGGTQIQGRLRVHIDAYPPDNRRRDLDNLFKATLDAIQHCGVIQDDGHIDSLSVERKAVVKNGRLTISIEAA